MCIHIINYQYVYKIMFFVFCFLSWFRLDATLSNVSAYILGLFLLGGPRQCSLPVTETLCTAKASVSGIPQGPVPLTSSNIRTSHLFVLSRSLFTLGLRNASFRWQKGNNHTQWVHEHSWVQLLKGEG